MKKSTFLVEIGTEELPSKILKRLGRDFSNQIRYELKKSNIDCIEISWFISSRHLGVKSKILVENICNKSTIHSRQENQESVSDISLNICNVNNQEKHKFSDVSKLHKNTENTKKEYVLQDVLRQVIVVSLKRLINYKMMRWGDIDAAFVRPIHNITILLDEYLIKGCFFGVNTDRILYGHRCVKENKIIIAHADDYPEILIQKGRVIVDYNRRKEIISIAVNQEAKKIGGVIDIQDNDLLEEITSLVEWPVVLSGQFNEKFLNLPNEIIHHIIKYDQKYFPVYSAVNSMLLPYFIVVANTITEDYSQIIIGYENVIKLRLMDADFFLKKDNQYCLEDYLSRLDTVFFHSKLGSLRDKSGRIAILSGWIAEKIGENVQQATRAGYLCKCDLMSSMVFEFPVNQGVVGMYYARRDGESEQVALAQKEHYYPRFAADILPTTYISCAVAIADKMDTISGIFGIKELPTGNRDPFALRRSAFGILRILIQKKLPINLFDLILKSVKLYGSLLINKQVINDIHFFMYKRLYSWYCMRNVRVNIIKAVLAIDYFSILDVDARICAVSTFCNLKKEENIELHLTYKRILNILSNIQISLDENVRNCLLKFPEEIQLANQTILIEEKIEILSKNYHYYDIIMLLVILLNPINQFFDKVVIIDQNQEIRKNRLILLNKVKFLFLKVMDFSILCS